MKPLRIALGACLLAGVLAAAAANRPSAPATAPVLPLQPFTDLPAPQTRPNATTHHSRIHAGTDGLALRPPAAAAGHTSVAVLGDLAPGDPATREKYLRMAVAEINLLRPDAVLTVGNLVPGLTRSGSRYVNDTQHLRALLDDLQMPWFPCAGPTDVVSGTRMPATPTAPGDRRFEELYRRYVGPLYFSLDIGGTDAAGGAGRGIHAIVLDSEEGVGAGNSLSETQLQWLQGDLNRTFESGRAQDVLVLLHRPLWREDRAGGNWRRAHQLLVEFNHRPVATVEGAGGTGIETRAPRVLAVLAGARRAYDLEPPVDGIRYYILGPTAAAARPGQSAADAPRHFTLLKVDADGKMHVALVQLGDAAAADAQTIVSDDSVTAQERAVLDAIAGWDEAALGVDGVVDVRGDPLPPPAPKLTFHAANPLPEAVDIQVRLAAGGWELTSPPLQRRLAAAGTPGSQAAGDLALRRVRAGEDRPVVEVVVRWPDTRGRVHELVLPRPIAVVPVVTLPVADQPLVPEDAEGWASAPQGVATPWTPSDDAPRKSRPTIALRADAQRLYLRVQVADDVPSYWPVMTLDPAWGGPPSDAVSLAWLGAGQQVRRIWVFPFAPRPARAPAGTVAIWSNTGLGNQQSALAPADPQWAIRAQVTQESGGYTVTLALPRQLVCEEIPAPPPPENLPPGGLAPPTAAPATRLAATARLNVAVYDNDETARTWTRSWSYEQAGPDAWAQLQLMQRTPEENRTP